MFQVSSSIIPVLSAEEGSCLTPENWHEVGVKTVVYYLDSLLLKPGIELLKTISDFKSYCGWSETLILNAANLSPNKEGHFILKSPYDGSKIQISYAELLEIIVKMKPDAVLLPPQILTDVPDFWAKWGGSIIPFFSQEDALQVKGLESYGYYVHLKNKNRLGEIKSDDTPLYVFGALDRELVANLVNQGIQFIEFTEPAQLAFQGQVYAKNEVLDLVSISEALNFQLIDRDCTCPTCFQKLTRAYLHHLFLHTPLLAQRFLIQHNVASVCK